MPLGAPIATLEGVIRRISRDEQPARPAAYDEQGTETRAAIPARVNNVVTIDTGSKEYPEAGMVDVIWDDSRTGEVPGLDMTALKPGESVALDVRPFVRWSRRGNQSRAYPGFSLAGVRVAPRTRTTGAV